MNINAFLFRFVERKKVFPDQTINCVRCLISVSVLESIFRWIGFVVKEQVQGLAVGCMLHHGARLEAVDLRVNAGVELGSRRGLRCSCGCPFAFTGRVTGETGFIKNVLQLATCLDCPRPLLDADKSRPDHRGAPHLAN
ncbi:hypothetical protein EVAR_36212_1 [Eumeta japonica]|uniref:Uncharacterized protein n=1 Tax=Eumeta variegata TaxID=151549 RepID=A0A4C1VQP8_EUMVA|nr:hypothetical protein EVAR_36212_1 [Eumeta japonica]